eukprot:m51a1_g66 hypothetical protein (207) ;mRNA; r:223704-224685
MIGGVVVGDLVRAVVSLCRDPAERTHTVCACRLVCRGWRDAVDQSLSLWHTLSPPASDDAIQSISALPSISDKVERLHLRRPGLITDYGLGLIADGFAALRELRLESCDRVTALGIRRCVRAHGPRLACIAVDTCDQCDDGVAGEIAASCSGLQELVLDSCENVSDGSALLVANSAAASTLVAVDLSYCPRVSTRGCGALLGASRE